MLLRKGRVLLQDVWQGYVVARLSTNVPSSERVPPEMPEGKEKYPGRDTRTIYGEEYPIWHKPLSERPEEFQSKFSILNSDKLDFTKKLPSDPTLSWGERFEKWFRKMMEEWEIEDQLFNPTRHKILGCDLATAHFICYRGGAVRFVGSDKWIKKERGKFGFEVELPPRFVPGMFLEGVDCEQFRNNGVRYEGFDNFRGLQELKWLSFKNCSRFDDWSLDRISNVVNETVEYLDIRGTSASFRGLTALARFYNLRFLLVDFKCKENEIEEMEQTLAILQEYNKDLLIKVGE